MKFTGKYSGNKWLLLFILAVILTGSVIFTHTSFSVQPRFYFDLVAFLLFGYISFLDMRETRILNLYIFIFLLLVCMEHLWNYANFSFTYLLAGFFAGSFFYILRRIHPRGIGLGDIGLVFVLGFWRGIEQVMHILFFAFLLGIFFFFLGLCFKKLRGCEKIAFVPFLFVSTVAEYFCLENF